MDTMAQAPWSQTTLSVSKQVSMVHLLLTTAINLISLLSAPLLQTIGTSTLKEPQALSVFHETLDCGHFSASMLLNPCTAQFNSKIQLTGTTQLQQLLKHQLYNSAAAQFYQSTNLHSLLLPRHLITRTA